MRRSFENVSILWTIRGRKLCSNLSSSKLRPAVALASVGRDDWILCKVTSNPYADSTAVKITDDDFETGSLQRVNYARPGKLFTANSSLMEAEAGRLNATAFKNILGLLDKAFCYFRRQIIYF